MNPDSGTEDERAILHLLIRALDFRLQALERGARSAPGAVTMAPPAREVAVAGADTPEVARLRKALSRNRPQLAASPDNAGRLTARDPDVQSSGPCSGTGVSPPVVRVPPLRALAARPRTGGAVRQSG